MHRILAKPLLLVLATLSPLLIAPVSVQAAVPEFSAVYVFERGRMTVGETRMQLEHTRDGIYRYTSVSEAKGFISLFVNDVIREESIYQDDGRQLAPISYTYRHEGSKKNRDEQIAYDWIDGVASIDYRGHKSQAELTTGTIDMFLLQIALMNDIRDNSIDKSYRVIDNGRVKTFHLRSDKLETINTPAGKFEAVRIEHANKNQDKRLRLWLARDLNYLPVRIEQEKRNEETLRLSLKSYEVATTD